MVLVLISLLCAAPALELEVGQQRVVPLPKSARVKVERPAVLEVREVGIDQLLLIGLSVGMTRLTVGAEVRSVRVVPESASRKVAELRSLLGPIPGLSLGFERGCPWYECPGCSVEARARVEEAVALFACVRAVHWVVPPRAAEVVLRGAREVLGEGPDDTPGLTLEVRDGVVVLLGVTKSTDDRTKVERVRKLFPELRVHVE